MATKVVITSYVDSLLGESGTQISDSTIIAGMEDFVHKLQQSNPDALKDLEVSTTIATVPVTIHFIPEQLDVYCGIERLTRQKDTQFIANRYSLLNDLGNTGYYYVVGNKLYIHPFDATKTYTYRGIAYSVSNGVVTWCDKYVYPLALYCAYVTLYAQLNVEVSSIVTASGTSTGLGTVDYNNVLPRLDADDVELTGAELDYAKTQIQQLGVWVGADGVVSDKMKSRVENAKMMHARMVTLWTQYMQYFGIGEAK